MHTNDESVERRIAHKFGWKLQQRGQKSLCISCAIGKSKEKKVSKTRQVKGKGPEEQLFIDISSMKIRSLGK